MMPPAQTPKSSLAYRPDIDGLRSIAIISVVIFHAFSGLLPGGFIGVDIFFVISGFLISSIIFRSLQRGDFSFVDFYLHRINRIFPALVVVLAACYAIGWFQLIPDEFKQLGKHMAASAGFIQNFVLWKESGYFDTASELKPLMHLWSLAIEEQFYLIYPLLVWIAWHLRWNTLTVVTGLFLLSFILNVTGVKQDPIATFFLPQTRFWELLAGSLLAGIQLARNINSSEKMTKNNIFSFGKIINTSSQKKLNDGLSIIGLLLIVMAAFGLHQGNLFPGWWALLPVCGTFLLIFTGPKAWVNRNILANRLMIFIGLISYPLYLWHWPILVFTRFAESGLPSLPIRMGAMVLTFLLAWLTYWLLERPLRKIQSNTKSIVISALLIAMGAFGFNAFKNEGFSARAKIEGVDEIFKITDLYTHFNLLELMRYGICHSVPLQTAYDNGCIKSADKSIFILGDSYAASLFSGIDELVKKRYNDYTINQLTDGNGPLFLNKEGETNEGTSLVQINNDRIDAVRKNKPSIVLIAWMINGKNGIPDKIEATARLVATVNEIKKVSPYSRVIVIGPVPEWNITLHRQVINFYHANHKPPPRYMSYGLNFEIKSWDKYLRDQLQIADVEYISAYEQLCNQDGCLTRVSNNISDLSAVDWGHLTKSGSIFLINKIEDLIFK